MKVEALWINMSNKHWTCDGQSDLSRAVLAAEVWSRSSDESRTYSMLISVCQQRGAQPPRGLQWVVAGHFSYTVPVMVVAGQDRKKWEKKKVHHPGN